MARILRGDIYWADLNPTKGREQTGFRPVLIISDNIFNERSGTVIAFAITSKEPKVGFPLVFEIIDSNLPKRSWVKISQIRTLSTSRLSKKLSEARPEDLAKIVEGLNEIIG